MSWGGMAADQLGWGMVEEGWRKGPWTAEEDRLLIEYVKLHGEGRWNSVSRLAGLKRNGKSCRLRWVNYLRPDLKRGQITPHEERIILELHARWGNRWSTIARSLPGRTDNEIKNYWRTHFKKKVKGSSDHHSTSEKSKARLLKRQQFHLQQQQMQQQQQQQQQQQNHQMFDMKELMLFFDETDHNNQQQMITKKDGATPTSSTAIPNHYYYSSSAEHDQQVFLYSMFNTYAAAAAAAAAAVPEGTNYDQDIIWDGLWNLDDISGNINYTRNALYHPSAAAAAAATPFC